MDQLHRPYPRKLKNVSALAKKGVLGGVPASRLYPGDHDVDDLLIVAATEVNTDECRAAYVKALSEVLA